MNKFDKQLKGDFVFKGARLSFENAENHFEAGEVLAGKEKFGLATSHIILAAEECAKSMMLYLKYHRPDFEEMSFPIDREKAMQEIGDYDFRSLFSNHKPKQDLAYVVSIFGQIIAELSPWPVSILEKVIFEGEELNQTDKHKILETRNKQEKRVEDWKRHSIIPDLGLKENSDWWKEVNENKNNGLYVGLENNKWKTPKDFTLQDYEIAYNSVSGFLALMERLLESQTVIDSYERG